MVYDASICMITNECSIVDIESTLCYIDCYYVAVFNIRQPIFNLGYANLVDLAFSAARAPNKSMLCIFIHYGLVIMCVAADPELIKLQN